MATRQERIVQVALGAIPSGAYVSFRVGDARYGYTYMSNKWYETSSTTGYDKFSQKFISSRYAAMGNLDHLLIDPERKSLR